LAALAPLPQGISAFIEDGVNNSAYGTAIHNYDLAAPSSRRFKPQTKVSMDGVTSSGL